MKYIYYVLYIWFIVLIFKYIFDYTNIIYRTNDHNNNNKIALCISGQLRHTKLFIKNLMKYVIIPYKPDIFMYIDNNKDNEIIKYIKKYIHPKKIIICNKIPYKQSSSGFTYNTYSMFEKIYKCNRLRIEYEQKNKINYDIIIRMRPDISINSYFNFKNFKNNVLYIPKYIGSNLFVYVTNIPNVFGYGIVDQLSYGSPNIMNIYCNTYKYILKLPKQLCIVPEITCKKYNINKNINIKYFYMNWNIIDYSLRNINILKIKKFLSKTQILNINCFV